MPGIIKGSILKFQSQVKVPSEGSSFATLRFTDTISNGLAYVQTPATVVEYKDADPTTPYTVIANPTISYTAPNLVIDITNGAVTNPAKDVLVRVTFYVEVTDLSAAINAEGNITNTAKFEMLDGSGETIGNPATATVEHPMTEYGLYVMGVAQTIQKTAGQNFSSVYFFGAMDGEAQDDLSYKLYIYPNTNFDFVPGTAPDYTDVEVTLNSLDGAAIDRTVTVAGLGAGVPAGTIIIEIPHAEDVSSGVIHVNVPTVSNANIVNAEEPQFILGDAELLDGTTVIARADKYNVQVNFTDEVKVLTDATKELILS